MNDKILIFGKGYIGEELHRYLNCRLTGKKIRSLKSAQEEIDKFKPKVIINCIGHIGRNVDDCELNKDKTLFANTFIPIILAEAALRNKIKLVHISSGCVYNFDYKIDKPIEESRVPDFFELFYSRSKIYSDSVLELLSDKFNILILRLRVPLDNKPHKKNLIDKLINYKKVIDMPNSVTYVPDFLKAVEHLLKINARGIYNVVNKGGLKYPKLMEIYKKYKPDFEYQIIDFKKLGLVRTNLVLSTKKLEKTGFKVRNIGDVLEECVENYLKY
jgi:3,5-epimerase/4-reductase